MLPALTRAMDHAGLRPRRIGTLDAYQAVCPACFPNTQGGRYLTLVGDDWPDVMCVNQACPTNPPPDVARAQLADDMRTLAAGGTPPLRGVWPHLGRVLGADVVAHLIRSSAPPTAPQTTLPEPTPLPRRGSTIPHATVPRAEVPAA